MGEAQEPGFSSRSSSDLSAVSPVPWHIKGMLSLRAARVAGTAEGAKAGMFWSSFLGKVTLAFGHGRGEGILSPRSSHVRAKHHLLKDASLLTHHPG